MSYVLTEEQQLIQQNAREFAEECVAPVAAEIDNTGAYPADIVKKMVEQDFLGIFLPGKFGGAEAGYLSYALIIEEISRVSGAVAAILLNHASLAAYSINSWGSEEQKQTYLKALCQGEKLGAFALNEPENALGVGEHKLVAVKDGDHYILTGRKCYVANGGVAGVYIVIAQTNAEAGAEGMSAFIVDGTAQGLSVARTIDNMGLRGCQSAELIFDQVKVPAANLLGTEGKGLAIAAKAQAAANIAEGAMVLGIAQAAMEDAVKYGKQRIQFGRPIASFPAIQTMLAEMAAHIHMLRLTVYDTAVLLENGEPFSVEAAMIKLFAARIGQSALIDVIQIEGGYGYSQEMVASRFYRDIKGVIVNNSSFDFPEKSIAKNLLA
ncbi:acyl-CoA dehydrogenase family protein [Sporomusa acidovorans]|uniref:Acyl-CoA dehydrogenase, short-chain specific n=1 Tax=Sporomusa acidovorans (strain ATCC 49682 / DSM 3132 / Mol) TaxID=1123286 RepID=A0ABZ3JB07_SPOA4|nr:acyl-CoA dehydrogenase family protein [Sporomusa acidovorans]OZC21705.1 acyl-CoA dehydrogenase [Sporomusa acidovorans DSM 3132]SDD59637.1 butyryl-CoA dehydrogenase [Sporomusa acidovorans]